MIEEIEQGIIGVNLNKHQLCRSRCLVDDNSQHCIAQAVHNLVCSRRDQLAVLLLEYLFPQLADPFLHGTQGAEISAKDGPEEESDHQAK